MKNLNKVLIGLIISLTISLGGVYALTQGTLDSYFTPNRAGVAFTLGDSCNSNSDCSGGFLCSQISNRCTHPGFDYATFNNFINNERIPGTQTWDEDERKFLAGAYCLSSDTCDLITGTQDSLDIYNTIPHSSYKIKAGDKVFFWIYFHNNGQSGNEDATATNVSIGIKNLNAGQTESGIFKIKPTGYIDSAQTSEITDNMGIKLDTENLKLTPLNKVYVVTKPDKNTDTRQWTQITSDGVNVKLHKTNSGNFIQTWATSSVNSTGMSLNLQTLPGCFEYSGFALFAAVVEEVPNKCNSLSATKVNSSYDNVEGTTKFVHKLKVNSINFEYDPPMSGLKIKWSAPSGNFYTKSGSTYTLKGNPYTTPSLNEKEIYYVGNGPATVKIVKSDGTVDSSVSPCNASIPVPLPENPTCSSITVTRNDQPLGDDATFSANALYTLKASTEFDPYEPSTKTVKFTTTQGYLSTSATDGLGYIIKAVQGGDPAPSNPPTNTVTVAEGTPVYFLTYNNASGGKAIDIRTTSSPVGTCQKDYDMSVIPPKCEQLYVYHNSKILTNTTSEFKAYAVYDNGAPMSNKIKYSVTPESGLFYNTILTGYPMNPFVKLWSPPTLNITLTEYVPNIVETSGVIIEGFIPQGGHFGPLTFLKNVVTKSQEFLAYVGEFTKASVMNLGLGMDLEVTPAGQTGLSADITQPTGMEIPEALDLFEEGKPGPMTGYSPDTSLYFVGLKSGEVTVETEGVDFSKSPNCKQTFPIVPAVCKDINVSPQLAAGNSIKVGQTKTFTAGSEWGAENDNTTTFESKELIMFSISDSSKGYLFQGPDTGTNHKSSIIVKPGEKVSFHALAEGDDVLTIDVNNTDEPFCTEKWDVTAAPIEETCEYVHMLIKDSETGDVVMGQLEPNHEYKITGKGSFTNVPDNAQTIQYTVKGSGQLSKPIANNNEEITLTIGDEPVSITEYIKAEAVNFPNVCNDKRDLVVSEQPKTPYCKEIHPTVTDSLETPITSNYLKEGQKYTISNTTEYEHPETVSIKSTQYKVLNSGGTLKDHGTDTSLSSTEILGNGEPIYFQVNSGLSDNTQILEIKDVFDGNIDCTEIYMVEVEEEEEDKECIDLEISSATDPDINGDEWTPTGDDEEYFEVNLDSEYPENDYEYHWTVSKDSGDDTKWDESTTDENNNTLEIDDIEEVNYIKIEAINKYDDDDNNDNDCKITLYPKEYTESKATVEKGAKDMTLGGDYEKEIIIVGNSTKKIKYRIHIDNNGSETIKFRDTGFIGGRIQGKFITNTGTNSVSEGYLEFEDGTLSIEHDSYELEECDNDDDTTNSSSDPCYTFKDETIESHFENGNDWITLINLSEDVDIYYEVENWSVATSENKCSKMEAETGCGEIFENKVEIRDISSGKNDEDSSRVISLCPYILTRGSGDVFFHDELEDMGSNLTCADLKNSLGVIIQPKKYKYITPKTGKGENDYQGEIKTLEAATNDICKNAGVNTPDEYNNPFKNFSSSICEMQSDVSKVWREPIINNAIQNNATKLGRWNQKQGPIEITNGLIDSNIMNKQGVVVINRDLTIKTNELKIKADSFNNIPAGQTYIINGGNLNIEKDITYDDTGIDIKDPRNIPSVAFIVINGNINISPNVGRLDGIYVALSDENHPDTGKIMEAGDAINSLTQLIIRGSLVGDVSDLFAQRRAPGNPRKDEGAIVINYDERLILNTPPGLSNFLDMSQMKVPHKF